MRRSTLLLTALTLLLATVATNAFQGQARALPQIADRTANLQKLDGFFPLYWDDATGTLYMEIPRLNHEVLYVSGLSAGLGSNDIGLDRAQLGGQKLVKFEKVGTRVMMVQPNYQYRAVSTNPAERRAVEDAFAKSILWGFTAIAESSGRVLVDLSDFIMRDTHGVVGNLGAGYRFDRTRSAVSMENTKAFPKNSEIDVTTTFISEGGGGGRGGGAGQIGGRIGDVTPSAEAVTLRLHHSFIELPDANYKMRAFDPRSGFGGYSYVDMATPIGDDVRKQFIRRHRIEKKDPSAAMSEPVKPIIYYVDRGTPEPIRSALVDGARWWNQAFEAAGFRNGFQVEIMPEGADPMDVRYNTITWVHRSTRGWSYGSSISDPRTGEIIKGHVTLGSLRVRQDYLILEGLLSPYTTGTEKPPQQMLEVVLARLRQLSAHEVGHTIGLGHNYYNSSKGRISVLDYPHPLITLKSDGTMDLSQAYATGIGEWDKVSIQFGYSHFAPGTDEAAALKRIIDTAWAQDVRYMTNQDLDGNGNVDQWNNGTDVAAEINRMLQVRRAGLERFGETAILANKPMALIEDVFVPLYLHHRYAVDSAVTVLGGQDYLYAFRGDGRTPTRWMPAAQQRKALDALMSTLKLNELTLSSSLLGKIPPRPPGTPRTRELFPRTTGSIFDPISPAVVATDMVLQGLLTNDRAARLVAQNAVDPSLPSLQEVLGRVVTTVFDAKAATPYEAEIKRAMERVVINQIMQVAQTAPMTQVRALTSQTLRTLQRRSSMPAAATNVAEGAHRQLIADDIKRFFEQGMDLWRPAATPDAPPGAPIGDTGMDYLLGLDRCFIRRH